MNYIIYLLLFINLSTSFINAMLEGESILGGDIPKEGEFKYMVSVQGDMQHICGGSIIDAYFVLTAAHCFFDKLNKIEVNVKYSIVAASHYVDVKEQAVIRIDIVRICVPREFTSSYMNPLDKTFYVKADIAVVKLSRELPIGNHPLLSKLQLPSAERFSSFALKKAVVAGFGCEEVHLKMDEKTKKLEEILATPIFRLKFAETLVFSNKLCQSRYVRTIYDSYICAQVRQHSRSEPEGVCMGDSGGPLVFMNTVIGVVSIRPGRCNERIAPSIYTRVSSFLTFINDVMNDAINYDMICARKG